MSSDGHEGAIREPAAAGAGLRAWMQDLGRKLRSVREAIGLSQAELAAQAGVSQGAISRLETGRGLATPLLVVLRTALALRDASRMRAPEAVPAETAPLLESFARHVHADGRFRDDGSSLDAGALELVRAYREMPDHSRRRLLEEARRAVAATMRGLPNLSAAPDPPRENLG